MHDNNINGPMYAYIGILYTINVNDTRIILFDKGGIDDIPYDSEDKWLKDDDDDDVGDIGEVDAGNIDDVQSDREAASAE